MYEYDVDFDGTNQEDAFDREMDARTAQAIAEEKEETDPLLQDPFTPEKLHELIQKHYGVSYPMEYVRIWFREYTSRNMTGPGVDIYDFVCELELDSM